MMEELKQSYEDTVDINKSLAIVRLQVLFLTLGQVAQLIGVSESTVRNMSKDGRFPKPYKLDTRTRWKASEIIAWADTLPKAETC